MRLAEKEESLLEKDLIFEQVTRLSNRVKTKADSGKTDTLNLAKDVSVYYQLLLNVLFLFKVLKVMPYVHLIFYNAHKYCQQGEEGLEQPTPNKNEWKGH